MSTVEAKLPLRTAMEARDRSAAVAAFAPDAILRSPFTDSLAFQGAAELDLLIGVILDVLEDLTYTDEVQGEGTAMLVGHAHVDGIRIQFADLLKLREDGLVEEMTVFFRPLPATTAALRRIGASLARDHSALRSSVVAAMAAPLAFMARTGDGVGVRLVKP